MDERHFNFYDHPQLRLPNQVPLLEGLEKLGYERKGNFVLTTESIGIPVTTMLLLLKDSLTFIEDEQNDMSLAISKQPISLLDFNAVKNEFPTILVAGQTPDFQFSKYESWALDPTPNISGSTIAYLGHDYRVSGMPSGSKLTDFLSSNDNDVLIYKKEIHSRKSIINQKSLMNVYKNIIMFVEFTYALSDRIKTEFNHFNKILNKNIQMLKPGKNIDSICQMRGGVIHEGSFKLDIGEGGVILLGSNRKEVIPLFNNTFSEVISWVNDNYGLMLKEL